MHEKSCHNSSSFITLTYSDEFLPSSYSINVRDLQLFNKRLLKHMGSFRFFACGEYGDTTQRPHYHLLVFGLDFQDRTLWRRSSSGFLLYRSETLEKIWPFGHCEVGDVSTQSAGYVARYIFSKVTGDAAQEHYTRVHPITGEVVTVKPEFITMSRGGRSGKGGIGSAWYDKFAEDCFPSDFVVVDGIQRPVPRYYKNKFQKVRQAKEAIGGSEYYESLGTHSDMQIRRLRHAAAHASDNTPRRLDDRRQVVEGRLAKLKRELDQ